jgi:hypothetical protein
MSEARDAFDEALDAALASYGKAPENDGLEQRILRRVAERKTNTPRMRGLAFALAAGVVAICSFMFWNAGRQAEPAYVIRALPAPTPRLELPLQPVPGRALRMAGVRVGNRTGRRPTMPKRAQFPTPYPVTGQERALVQWALLASKDMAGVLTPLDAPVKPVSIATPIQIAAVEVKPLD